MTATSRALLVLIAVTAGLGGCVFRPSIQQGNLLEVEEVEEVKTGMTRSQVRYVLGTPMLADPFDPQRWDYIYTFRAGRERKVDRAHFVVHFEGDKVSRVEKLDLPDERTARVDRKKSEMEKKKSAEKLRESGSAQPLERGDQPPAAPPPSGS
jgi:outer membrane protein assembly factor BamE